MRLRDNLVDDDCPVRDGRLAQQDSITDGSAVPNPAVSLDVNIGPDDAVLPNQRAALDEQRGDQMGVNPNRLGLKLRVIISGRQEVAVDAQQVGRAGQGQPVLYGQAEHKPVALDQHLDRVLQFVLPAG